MAATELDVAIVGAGFSGIGLGMTLLARGERSFTIFERSDGVGGTWLANAYPGAACDAPSHLYRYSFARKSDWSRRYAPRDEILRYAEDCARTSGVIDHVRFGTTVREACWERGAWTVMLGDGGVVRARVLVAATGQLSNPRIPDLPGRDTFAGPQLHSAQWDDDVQLDDRRVAVVGTGASAIQVVPAIADRVRQLTVLQRTPSFVMTKSDPEYKPLTRALYRRAPLLTDAPRATIYMLFEAFTRLFTRQPDKLRRLAGRHATSLEATVRDPALRAALTPSDVPGCRRILLSTDYHAAFNRPNVALVTEPIAQVQPEGIRTTDGVLHPADVIVWCTGFRTEGYPLETMQITGRDGVRLADRWADGATAYLGLSVPGFPNLFLMYGPHTNLGSGSILYMLEAQMGHIADAVTLTRRGAALEVKDGVARTFAAEVQGRLKSTVWGTGCSSWYQDAAGRNTHNWPGLMREYRRRARRLDPADYVLTGPRP